MGTVQDIMKMEKRLDERKNVILEAGVVYDGVDYPGVIENISEGGLHLIVATNNRSIRFIPGICVRLHIKSLSGEDIDLDCEVKWVHINKTPVYSLIFRMGLNIIEQTDRYREYIEELKGDLSLRNRG